MTPMITTLQKRRRDRLVITSVLQEVANCPLVDETTFSSPVVSPPDPRIKHLDSSSTHYEYDHDEREITMSVFDACNQIHA